MPINVYSRAWAQGRIVFTVLFNIVLCPFSHILVAIDTSLLCIGARCEDSRID